MVYVMPHHQPTNHASYAQQWILLYRLLAERSASQAKRNLASDLLCDSAFNNPTIRTDCIHKTLLTPYQTTATLRNAAQEMRVRR